MTNTSVPQPESVPQPDKEPYHPPTRQDYEDLIEHHYLIRAFTFFPLIIVAVSMYMDADYGPLHFLTGVAMNVGVLATCLTVPLAIPVMIRDAREARERGVDKAIPRRRLWKVAGRVAISLAFGASSIAYLTPLVRDANDGSRNVPVTSCTNTVAQRQQRTGSRGRSRVINYEVYEITMQLADGSTRVQDMRLHPRDNETASSQAVYDVLYEACVTNPGTTGMTLEIMPHSWTILTARLD